MADNVDITPGAGKTIATDDIGGVQYQRFKLTLGADAANDGDVSATNPIPAKLKTSGTATTSAVGASIASVTLLASNASRLGATIVNDGTQKLYVKCGTTATSTDYTKLLLAGEYWELPFGYTGRIDGIWAVANGNARITEFT